MDPLIPKEVKILESAEDIQNRRSQVLGRYSEFKAEARLKREKLEDSRRFQVIQYLYFLPSKIIWNIRFINC